MATKTNTTIHGKNYYRIKRTVGHKYADGKKVPIYKQFYGTSKANAEKQFKEWQEAQLRAKYEEQEAIDAAKLKSFGEYAEEFTYDILPNSSYALATISRYEISYRIYVKDSFLASIPLKDVRARTLQDYYASLDVSKQTLKAIRKWLAAFYKWLMLNDISDNVLAAVPIPDKPDNKRHDQIVVWEQEEIRTILTASDGHRLQLLIYLLYYAGLRISECLGLKYSDLKNNTISVNRQYYRGHILPPKAKSYRNIPMHKSLIPIIEKHTVRFKKEAELKGYETEFVFTSKSGRLLDYTSVGKSLSRFYKTCGVCEKNMHAYRATFCTDLCRAGVPIQVASKLMGHKSVEVTAKHYALVKQDIQEAAINMLPSATKPMTPKRIKRPRRISRISAR